METSKWMVIENRISSDEPGDFMLIQPRKTVIREDGETPWKI